MKHSALVFILGSVLAISSTSGAQTPIDALASGPNFPKRFFEEGRAIAHELDGLVLFPMPEEWRRRSGTNLPPSMTGIVAACPKNVVPESCVPAEAFASGWQVLESAALGGVAFTAELKPFGAGTAGICTPVPQVRTRVRNIESRLARWSRYVHGVSKDRISIIAPRAGGSRPRPAVSQDAANLMTMTRPQLQKARSAMEVIMGRCRLPNDQQLGDTIEDLCKNVNCADPELNCIRASCCETPPPHCQQSESPPSR